MPVGNPEGYCSCCGSPVINSWTDHDKECIWDESDELKELERRQQDAIDVIGNIINPRGIF